jgi:hypothetical protein
MNEWDRASGPVPAALHPAAGSEDYPAEEQGQREDEQDR